MRFFLARNPKLAKDILLSTRICKQDESFSVGQWVRFFRWFSGTYHRIIQRHRG